MSERILEDFEPGELTCQELAELVSDYIEGVLTPPLHEQIVAHLAGCSDCSAYVEQVRTTIAVTGEIASGDALMMKDIVPNASMPAIAEAMKRGWLAISHSGRGGAAISAGLAVEDADANGGKVMKDMTVNTMTCRPRMAA